MYRVWHSTLQCTYVNTLAEAEVYCQMQYAIEGRVPRVEKVEESKT